MTTKMLTLSRDAIIKMGRHAWNVYPFDAFGYLIGTSNPPELFATLPCSRTQQLEPLTDVWPDIDEHFALACKTAQKFGLEVIGVYRSQKDSQDSTSIPSILHETNLKLLIIYYPICCTSHSGKRIYINGQRLAWENYQVPPGKRPARELSQKRIHRAWRKAFGPVDHTNTNKPLTAPLTDDDSPTKN